MLVKFRFDEVDSWQVRYVEGEYWWYGVNGALKVLVGLLEGTRDPTIHKMPTNEEVEGVDKIQ